MRQVSYGTLIERSFSRTGDILFRPFSLGKWARLLFMAFLAGAYGYGGRLNLPGQNFDWNWGQNRQTASARVSSVGVGSPVSPASSVAAASPVEAEPVLAPVDSDSTNILFGADKIKKWIVDHWFYIMPGTVFLAGLWVLFLWLNSRFRFVWFNAAVNNVGDISQPFDRFRRQGNSLFGFELILSGTSLAFLALSGFWIYALASSEGIFAADYHWSLKTLLVFLPPMILAVPVFILIAFLSSVAEQWVVPLMAAEDEAFLPSVKRLADLLKAQPKDFFLFLLVVFGLRMAAEIAVMIVSLLVALVFLLAGGIVGGLGWLIFGLWLKAKWVLVPGAVLLGVPAAGLFILFLFAASLPVALFFRVFSIQFLSTLNNYRLPVDGTDALL